MEPLSGVRRIGLRNVVAGVQWVVGVAAATCVVMLFTLGGADPDPSPDTADDTADPSASDPEVLAVGAEVYAAQCSVCHGRDGQGATGPRLAGTVVTLYPDVAEQIRVVTEGGNGMPAYATRLSTEEIAAVVAWTREGL